MSLPSHKVIPAFFVTMLLTGCGEESNIHARYELAAKSEYSVLQSYEHRYRNLEHSEPYIVRSDALDTSFDVFALPVKGQDEGYVWFIANPDTPFIKAIPDDVDFVVEQDAVDAIVRSTRLAPTVKAYLRETLAGNGHIMADTDIALAVAVDGAPARTMSGGARLPVRRCIDTMYGVVPEVVGDSGVAYFVVGGEFHFVKKKRPKGC